MPNILVTGSNGQVGLELQALAKEYSYNFYFADKNTLDITQKEAVEMFCNTNKITCIINCAAYTAVDKAEKEKELANLVNHIAVKNLAQISKENNISLIQFSTDYVFDGKNYKPYSEDDAPNPLNFYGQTKLDGELALKEINPKNFIIIRTSWLYSSFGNNFVKTILKLSKKKDELDIIFDQIGTPTYARDLAKTILEILPRIDNIDAKIYHYSNEGIASWYDFAKAIFKIKNITTKVNPIETKDYITSAKRPYYSVLNKSKIKEDFGISIPYWGDSLKECLREIK